MKIYEHPDKEFLQLAMDKGPEFEDPECLLIVKGGSPKYPWLEVIYFRPLQPKVNKIAIVYNIDMARDICGVFNPTKHITF